MINLDKKTDIPDKKIRKLEQKAAHIITVAGCAALGTLVIAAGKSGPAQKVISAASDLIKKRS